MLIIEVKKGNIEQALKALKYKVKATKQTQSLRERKRFEKPSIKKRKLLAKAKYIQRKRDL